jgi:3-phenylpropionate/trans-cinnamate dioxygenase ferredoxin reductase subunit
VEHHKYLIIGGGMTADAAAKGIREVDPSGSIGLIGSELDPPYDRPPLSKKLWKGKPFESLWRGTRDKGVDLHLGRTVQVLNPNDKVVTDDQRAAYSYDKLLLATGCTPRRLSFGGQDIIYYRTVQDYRKLRLLSEDKQRFAVIGGGFIGSEVAAALAMNGKDVTMIFPDEGIGWRLFPAGLSHFVGDYYRQKGVTVLARRTVEGVAQRGDQFLVKCSPALDAAEPELIVDGIVTGIGVTPNVQLAQQAGLEVANGVVVDEHLCTSHPDIYAAGDVASFYNQALDQCMRVEHEDNANTMGRAAGRNMAGAGERYNHLPYFYSDLFELGYEAVGDTDSRLETVEDWHKEPFQKGVVYYLRAGRVRGVLLWNVWDQVPNARQLIAAPGPFHPKDLIGRLPA